MRRDEAVKLLKEVSDKCPSLTPYAIALMPPDADDVYHLGFRYTFLQILMKKASYV